MMKQTNHPSPPNEDPLSELIFRTHHLQRLLENLPLALPLDPPESTYLVDEGGVWFALNGNLEVCSETHKWNGATAVFRGHGKRYHALIQIFKAAAKQMKTTSERDFVRAVWFERLIAAAELQGAKITAK